MNGRPRGGGAIASSLLPVIPALLAPVAVLLARASGGPAPLLPILATLAVYPILAILLLRGRRAAAAVSALLWAASLSGSIIAITLRDPVSVQRLVPNGAPYRDEMFAFIRSGTGRESDPARFLPEHAAHLTAFGVLALVSGGLLGIALGALLVGYMSFYVGALATAGGAPQTALLLGWPPWAILRVAAFILIGLCLAEPLLFRAARRLGIGTPAPAPRRPFYIAAAALLALDIVLKLLFAPAWAALLRPCLAP